MPVSADALAFDFRGLPTYTAPGGAAVVFDFSTGGTSTSGALLGVQRPGAAAATGANALTGAGQGSQRTNTGAASGSATSTATGAGTQRKNAPSIQGVLQISGSAAGRQSPGSSTVFAVIGAVSFGGMVATQRADRAVGAASAVTAGAGAGRTGPNKAGASGVLTVSGVGLNWQQPGQTAAVALVTSPAPVVRTWRIYRVPGDPKYF